MEAEKYEPFLVNPIGRPVGRKGGRKKNAWPDDPQGHRDAANIGWAKRETGQKGYTQFYGAHYPRNPVGGELMLVTNPVIIDSRGGVKVKRKNAKRKNDPAPAPRRRRRHTLYSNAPRRRSGRRRHNPIIGGIDVNGIVVGALSAMATVSIPAMLKMDSPATKYGAQIATAFAGKVVLGALKSPNANTWLTVGLSMLAADVIREYVIKKIAIVTATGKVVEIPANTPARVTQVAPKPGDQQQNSGMGEYLNESLAGYLDELPADYRLAPVGNAIY